MSIFTSHENEPGTSAAVDQFFGELERSGGTVVLHELLSDLDRAGAQRLNEDWERIPRDVRVPLVRRMVEDAEVNIERSYGRVMRIAFSDPDPDARLAALEGLWEYDAPGLLEEMLDIAASEPDERVRAAVAEALAQYSRLAELEELEAGTSTRLSRTLLDLYRSDPSRTVRRRALESVSFISGNREIAEAIRQAYESGIFEMMVSALRAMGHQAVADWLPVCYSELSSDEPELRYEAVTAIGAIMDERSSTKIVDMLSDNDAEVRMAAVGALGSIGGPIAINALRRLIDEEDDELLVEAAEEALAEARLMENPLRPPL